MLEEQINIKTAKETYLQFCMVKNTLITKNTWINKFIDMLPEKEATLVNEINLDHINNCLKTWWNTYQKGKTYNFGRTILLGFLKWGCEEGNFSLELKKSLLMGKKQEDEILRKPYSKEEIAKFVQIAKKKKKNIYF